MRQAFQRLKPRERQLLWLAYVEGSSHKEIADCTGLRAGSIRLLLFRARRKLAELIGASSHSGDAEGTSGCDRDLVQGPSPRARESARQSNFTDQGDLYLRLCARGSRSPVDCSRFLGAALLAAQPGIKASDLDRPKFDRFDSNQWKLAARFDWNYARGFHGNIARHRAEFVVHPALGVSPAPRALFIFCYIALPWRSRLTLEHLAALGTSSLPNRSRSEPNVICRQRCCRQFCQARVRFTSEIVARGSRSSCCWGQSSWAFGH